MRNIGYYKSNISPKKLKYNWSCFVKKLTQLPWCHPTVIQVTYTPTPPSTGYLKALQNLFLLFHNNHQKVKSNSSFFVKKVTFNTNTLVIFIVIQVTYTPTPPSTGSLKAPSRRRPPPPSGKSTSDSGVRSSFSKFH